jgi:hypothetical protein
MAMPIDAASLCEEGRRSKRNANILIQWKYCSPHCTILNSWHFLIHVTFIWHLPTISNKEM